MHWDQYWNVTDSLSSFGDSGAEFGYPDEVLQFWRDLVLSREGRQYLDLATGKGALAVWLQSLINSANLNNEVYACDLANINRDKITSSNPAIKKAISQINFSFNTPLETLPYPDKTFDVLVSQFGFEYGDWNKTLPEAIRVLNNNGVICLMLHHPESVITKDSKAGIKILKWVIEERIFEDLANIINTKLSSQNSDFDRLNTNLIKKIQACTLSSEDEKVWYNDLLSKISQIMININVNSHSHVKSLEKSAIQQISRLEDQVSVALSKEQIINNINQSGIAINSSNIAEFYVEGSLFSWTLEINV